MASASRSSAGLGGAAWAPGWPRFCFADGGSFVSIPSLLVSSVACVRGWHKSMATSRHVCLPRAAIRQQMPLCSLFFFSFRVDWVRAAREHDRVLTPACRTVGSFCVTWASLQSRGLWRFRGNGPSVARPN
nr:hypothetical protein [Pandoravirus belohorizontensis]